MSTCFENARSVDIEPSLKTEYCKWLTTTEASIFMGISNSRLHNLVSLGKVPYYKLGRSNRYLKSELNQLLLSQPRGVRNGH